MFAEWLHNTYENLAEEKGWRTQLQCQTEFKKLPKKNQAVMIQMACKIKKQFHMFFDKIIEEIPSKECYCESLDEDAGLCGNCMIQTIKSDLKDKIKEQLALLEKT